MRTQHTPGPWQLQDQRLEWHGKSSDWHYGLRIAAQDNCHLAQVGHMDASYKDQAESNARLMAAAPELLQALVEVLEEFDRYEDAMATMPAPSSTVLWANPRRASPARGSWKRRGPRARLERGQHNTTGRDKWTQNPQHPRSRPGAHCWGPSGSWTGAYASAMAMLPRRRPWAMATCRQVFALLWSAMESSATCWPHYGNDMDLDHLAGMTAQTPHMMRVQ